jgi:hypothetical protein
MSAGSLYATARPSNWFSKLAHKFLEAIDLSENINRVTTTLKTIPNGFQAFLLFPFAALFFLVVASFAWFFDIDSSYVATNSLADRITTALQGSAVIGVIVTLVVAWLPFGITLAPTVAEMLGAKFARMRVAVFQWAVWTAVVFDLITDIPRVNEQMLPVWESWTGGHGYGSIWAALFAADFHAFFAGICWSVAWVVVLLAASYFLELLAVLMLWITISLLMKSVGYAIIGILAGRGFFEFISDYLTDVAGKARRQDAAAEAHEDTAGDNYNDWKRQGGGKGSSRRRDRKGKGGGQGPVVIDEELTPEEAAALGL